MCDIECIMIIAVLCLLIFAGWIMYLARCRDVSCLDTKADQYQRILNDGE